MVINFKDENKNLSKSEFESSLLEIKIDHPGVFRIQRHELEFCSFLRKRIKAYEVHFNEAYFDQSILKKKTLRNLLIEEEFDWNDEWFHCLNY